MATKVKFVLVDVVGGGERIVASAEHNTGPGETLVRVTYSSWHLTAASVQSAFAAIRAALVVI